MAIKYGSPIEAAKHFEQVKREGGKITREMARAAYTAGGSLPKDLSLAYWKDLEPGQPIAPVMTPLPPDAEGSTYGACGIRIDGNPEFIDAVLSRLKDLIPLEGEKTRLGFARSKVKAKKIKEETKAFNNAEGDAECVYIRVHERGLEAQMAAAFCKAMRAEPCKNTESMF